MSDLYELPIATAFSPFPGGRTRKDGDFSGAVFRDNFLKPALDNNKVVKLILDGVAGLPSSFWEEVFGGLIRNHILAIEEIGTRLRLQTSDPELRIYIPMALKYAKDVADKLENEGG
jgi:hypothetical protein